MQQEKNIWFATLDGDLERIKQLIDLGEDVNQKNEKLWTVRCFDYFCCCHCHCQSFWICHFQLIHVIDFAETTYLCRAADQKELDTIAHCDQEWR